MLGCIECKYWVFNFYPGFPVKTSGNKEYENGGREGERGDGCQKDTPMLQIISSTVLKFEMYCSADQLYISYRCSTYLIEFDL